jgi:hypothetical protein
MTPAGPLFHKPKSIIAAKNILFANVFLYLVILFIIKTTNGFELYLNTPGIIISIVVIVLLFILTRLIGFRKKWARALLTVLVVALIAQAVLFPFVAYLLFRANLLIGVLLIVQSLLQLLALRFLYAKESNLWFNNDAL